MIPKPSSCRGCVLEHTGTGFVPPTGPVNSPLLFMAEAAGYNEARLGEPLVGDAGQVFNRLLYRRDIDREAVRLGNVLFCQPPRNYLLGAPWEHEAINHCRVYRDALLQEDHKVIVAMGAAPIKTLLGLSHVKVQDFHGTVHQLPSGQYVVCTYHPSFLQRGGRALTQTVLRDIEKAQQIAREGWAPSQPTLHLDPAVEWFREWVDMLIATAEAGQEVWFAVDIETPTKIDKGDEGSLTLKDRTYMITRVNFCCDAQEALTVPFLPGYIEQIQRLLEHPSPNLVKLFWHHKYDVPILEYCEPHIVVAGRIIDMMDGWHFLQSDVPRGLGFVSPFFSDFGAWKHLSDSQPAYYGAADGLQTFRNGVGIASLLVSEGMWDSFISDFVEVDEYMFRPAEKIGVLVDIEGLPKFSAELLEKERGFMRQAQRQYPEELQNVFPRGGGDEGWKKDPGPKKLPTPLSKLTDEELEVFCRKVDRVVPVCKTCGALQVPARHRCKDKSLTPQVVHEKTPVDRWFVKEPFNPGSPEQVLRYIQHFNHRPGKNPKTGNASADKTALQRLAKPPSKGTKAYEPHVDFYQAILDFREVDKVRGTYVDSTLTRLKFEREVLGDFSNRLKPTFHNKPSTFRTSCTGPNLQNVVADRGGKESLAAGFRRYIMAQEDSVLIEADYSAIEAVLTGYFARDPEYIRLAQLGVHAYLCSHLIKQPADLGWSDEKLSEYFSWLKEEHKADYNMAKRCVHGTNYGLTPFGMRERFPSIFPSVAAARKVQNLYLELCGKLKTWQGSVIEFAGANNYLGGPGNHPFDYRHWFWDVYAYRKTSEIRALRLRREGKAVVKVGNLWYEVARGEDAKRAVAFYPQSSAAGVIRRAGLRLFKPDSPHYIGDRWHEMTPLRALIHDSFLLEVEKRHQDYVVEQLYQVMTMPVPELPVPEEWNMGTHLSFGCKIEVGSRWSEMEGVKVDAAGVRGDTGVIDEWDDPDEAAEYEAGMVQSWPA